MKKVILGLLLAIMLSPISTKAYTPEEETQIRDLQSQIAALTEIVNKLIIQLSELSKQPEKADKPEIKEIDTPLEKKEVLNVHEEIKDTKPKRPVRVCGYGGMVVCRVSA